jgi:hypothetical protein
MTHPHQRNENTISSYIFIRKSGSQKDSGMRCPKY